jgi:hypothetical protein
MTDDAQRQMQERALRNVRGLVDKIEAGDRDDKRTQRMLLVAVLAGGALILGTIMMLAAYKASSRTESVVLPPPKPGQMMPQAPRAPQ